MKRSSIATSLYRLIYCSRRSGPPPGLADPEIVKILEASRRRNTDAGLTGALLFTGGSFAQVLEGQRDAVEQAFERIGTDPRHESVTILSITPIERRCFPDSPMSYCDEPPEGSTGMLAALLSDAESGRPRVVTGLDILRMLESLVRNPETIA